MKKSLKALSIVLLVIVIVVVAAVIIIDLFVDRAAKIGIENAATKTLNVGVDIDDIDISIMGGKLALQNLIIKNPPGYQHDKLLELRNAKIEVNVRSLLNDVVNIREIKLDGMELTLEQRGVSGNNLQDVIKSIPSKDKQASEPSGKKLHIDNLEISDITVKVKLLPVPGKADTVTLELSPIKMTDLGSDNKLDTAELSGRILLAIAEGVAEQGGGVLPKNMVDTMKSTLDKTLGLGKATSDKGQELIDVGKGLFEGLIKPKKKE
ncbi:MAG: AsmA family protein [Phycisphaerae bacterium]